MKITDFVNIYISEQKDGNMSSKHAGEEIAVKNRKRFFEKNNLDYKNLVYMSVDTQSNFRFIDKHIVLNSEDKVNGLITQNKNLILGLCIADCAPVVLFDQENKILSLLHCGMFNIENKILENALKFMRSNLSTNTKDILAYIGPAISKENYIYNNNILLKLGNNSEVRKTLIKTSEDEYHIDITQTIKNILIKEGVKEESILDSKIDTYTDKRYPSHVYAVHNNLPESRFLTVAKIKDLL